MALQRIAQRRDDAVGAARRPRPCSRCARPARRDRPGVIITTTDSRGALRRIDCGNSMPWMFWMTPLRPEYTSRKATITERMSMSGIRFSSARRGAAGDARSMRRARGMLMTGPHVGRIADRDVREQLRLDDRAVLLRLEGAHAVHDLHQDVVGRVGLEQQRGVGLLGIFLLHALQVSREALVVVAARRHVRAVSRAGPCCGPPPGSGPCAPSLRCCSPGGGSTELGRSRRQVELQDRECARTPPSSAGTSRAP